MKGSVSYSLVATHFTTNVQIGGYGRLPASDLRARVVGQRLITDAESIQARINLLNNEKGAK